MAQKKRPSNNPRGRTRTGVADVAVLVRTSTAMAEQMRERAEALGLTTSQAWRLAAEMFLRPVAVVHLPAELVE